MKNITCTKCGIGDITLSPTKIAIVNHGYSGDADAIKHECTYCDYEFLDTKHNTQFIPTIKTKGSTK